MAAAPADSTCSHSGIFTCGPARLTTAMTSGAREPVSFGFDVLRLGIRILGRKRRDDRLAGREAGLALENDETPGHELAVIGHAGSNRQQGLDLGRGGTGAGQFDRLDRAAGLEQLERVGHPGISSQLSVISQKSYAGADCGPRITGFRLWQSGSRGLFL